MGLQKSVELIKGCNAQKAAQSGLADVSAFIFLQSECFQCAARQVAGSGAELNGQVGGDFNRQVHVEL